MSDVRALDAREIAALLHSIANDDKLYQSMSPHEAALYVGCRIVEMQRVSAVSTCACDEDGPCVYHAIQTHLSEELRRKIGAKVKTLANRLAPHWGMDSNKELSVFTCIDAIAGEAWELEKKFHALAERWQAEAKQLEAADPNDPEQVSMAGVMESCAGQLERILYRNDLEDW